MNHVFLDTDVILDIVTGRKPFLTDSASLFSLIDKKQLKASTTSLTFSNLYYILRKYSSHSKVITLLVEVADLLQIINVDEEIIRMSLRSRFKDFEDAIQFHSAKTVPEISVIITRNSKDYKPSDLPVMSPGTFLQTYNHAMSLGE
jgi:predicted nucleic acid-binding protein